MEDTNTTKESKHYRDVLQHLSEEDLEIYNKFSHGKNHSLHSIRRARQKQRLLEALKQTRGYVGKACDMVGISRVTYYSYVSEDPLFAEMVMEIREENIDFAEDKLLKNVESGFEASIIFYLKTQGRRRGYSDANVPGSFQGTQEEYYQNRFKDLDDTQLLDEIKSLRDRLKIGKDVSIGGFDGGGLLDDPDGEEKLLEESSVVNVNEEPKVKDIILDIEEYKHQEEDEITTIINKEIDEVIETNEGVITEDNLTPSQRLDKLLGNLSDKNSAELKDDEYKNKHIIRTQGNNDFRNLLTKE